MILMLDFDGVLHPDPCHDMSLLFCRLPMLEEVLCENPHVEIVISSTWRAGRSIDELRSFFSPSIARRLIGVTPSWRDHEELAALIGPTYIRSIEIEAWLRSTDKPWRTWVALDDKPYWFRPFCKNLLTCDPRTGLSQETAIKLRQRLQKGS
jgi:hypothetical protein